MPLPLAVSNNVLLLEMIGDGEAAPKLKDSIPDDPPAFLQETIVFMKKLYKGNLVHADLSAFNILNHREKPVFIDMSQSTPLDNMLAGEYLQRDVYNVCTFFRKIGCECDDETVLKAILS